MKYRLKGEKTYIELVKHLTTLEEEGNDILDKYKTDIQSLKKLSDEWVSKVSQCISNFVNPQPKKLIDKFKYAQDEQLEMLNSIGLFSVTKNEDQTSYQRNAFRHRLKEFKRLKNYLRSIDALRLNSINPEIKINSISEKLDYILKKLYELYGDEFYSIRVLLEINNINFAENEPEEIGEVLRKKGYTVLENKYLQKDSAKISIKGAEYIERKFKKGQSEKLSPIINKRMDEILQKLKELGYGQQIIFDELDELRSLYSVLPKKSWTQLLKGKVMDLVLSEIINRDTASYIFKELTDKSIKFIQG